MNYQEHNYYYYRLSVFLFRAKSGYIKGQIQILDLYSNFGLGCFQ